MSSGWQDQVWFVETSPDMLPHAEEVAGSNDRFRFQYQFFKTERCSFYAKGKCTRGELCKYAHGDDELCFRPDLTNTSLCYNWAATGMCSNPVCKFAHNPQQLRATGRFYKTSLCKFHLEGSCRTGRDCRHAHGIEELRPTPAALPSPLIIRKGDTRSQRRKHKARSSADKAATSLTGLGCLAAESLPGASSKSVSEQQRFQLQQAPTFLDQLSLNSHFGGFLWDVGFSGVLEGQSLTGLSFCHAHMQGAHSLRDPEALGSTSGSDDIQASADESEKHGQGHRNALAQGWVREGGSVAETQ